MNRKKSQIIIFTLGVYFMIGLCKAQPIEQDETFISCHHSELDTLINLVDILAKVQELVGGEVLLPHKKPTYMSWLFYLYYLSFDKWPL